MAKRSAVASRRVVIRKGPKSYEVTPACVVLRGGTIEKVVELSPENYLHELSECEERFKVEVKDFGSRLVSPAFVNPHTHLAMSFFRGFSIPESTKRNMIEDLFFHVESRLTAADVRAFTRMGAFECLLNGVGYVWDHYYFGNATAQALADVGLTGMVCPTLQDLAGPGVPWLEKQWAEISQIAESKKMQNAAIGAGIGVHATDTCSKNLWRKAIDESRLRKLPIHAHVAQSYEEYKKVQERERESPAEFLDSLGAFEHDVSFLAVHGIYLSRGDLQRMKKGRVALCFCPFSQLVFNFPANVMEWENAAIPWGVATDCVASNDSMNLQKELRFLSGVPNGTVTQSSAYQGFLQEGKMTAATATSDCRSSLQMSSMAFSDEAFLLEKSWEISPALGVKVGRIEAGFLANLVVWDTSHPSFWPGTQPLRCLAMADTSLAIYNMMTNGEWLGRDGDYHRTVLSSHGYKEAAREAGERLAALHHRL